MIFYDKPTQIPKSKQNQQNAQITHIVVEKSKRILSLYAKDEVIKTYPIALGGNPTGHKHNLRETEKHLKGNIGLILKIQIRAIF